MTELSLKIGNRVLVAREPSEDLTAKEITEMFLGLMVGQTFLEDTVIDAFSEYVEEA